MRFRSLILVMGMSFLATLASPQDAQRGQPSAKAEERIIREVRHELLMLPYFGVFDYIAYKVDGYNVTLMGQVVWPALKSDAESAVKHIEGVEKVDNQIEILPPSPMDDGLRRRLFRAIYQYPPLQRYELGVQKPIRIVVKNGRLTLEGVVDSDADKNLVGSSRRQRVRTLLGDQQSAGRKTVNAGLAVKDDCGSLRLDQHGRNGYLRAVLCHLGGEWQNQSKTSTWNGIWTGRVTPIKPPSSTRSVHTPGAEGCPFRSLPDFSRGSAPGKPGCRRRHHLGRLRGHGGLQQPLAHADPAARADRSMRHRTFSPGSMPNGAVLRTPGQTQIPR